MPTLVQLFPKDVAATPLLLGVLKSSSIHFNDPTGVWGAGRSFLADRKAREVENCFYNPGPEIEE